MGVLVDHKDAIKFKARTATNSYQSTSENAYVHGVVACQMPGFSPLRYSMNILCQEAMYNPY